MQLSDRVKLPSWELKQWPKDPGLTDGTIAVATALASGYGHARLAQERSAAILAQVGALKGTLDALTAALAAHAAGSTLNVDNLIAAVRHASEDGAKAPLAAGLVDVDVTVHDKTQETP